MKNKFLLASVAVFAFSTTNALAVPQADVNIDGNVQTIIHAKAKLITNLSIREVSELNFGSILAPRNNQVIKITPAGSLGTGTNATFAENDYTAGQIAINGDYFNDGDFTIHDTSHTGESYRLTFPDSLQLKSGDTVCGTVTNFEQDHSVNDSEHLGEELTISYGGTFTLANNIETALDTNQTTECSGEATVTLVYNYYSLVNGTGN